MPRRRTLGRRRKRRPATAIVPPSPVPATRRTRSATPPDASLQQRFDLRAMHCPKTLSTACSCYYAPSVLYLLHHRLGGACHRGSSPLRLPSPPCCCPPATATTLLLGLAFAATRSRWTSSFKVAQLMFKSTTRASERHVISSSLQVHVPRNNEHGPAVADK